jgi:hypothetical protein
VGGGTWVLYGLTGGKEYHSKSAGKGLFGCWSNKNDERSRYMHARPAASESPELLICTEMNQSRAQVIDGAIDGCKGTGYVGASDGSQAGLKSHRPSPDRTVERAGTGDRPETASTTDVACL